MALVMALKCKRGGCALLATVCSSWVFMSRSQSLACSCWCVTLAVCYSQGVDAVPGILWATGQSGLLKMPTWLGDLKTSFDMKSHRSSSALNVMVSRVTLLLYIFAAKDIYWIYEQPGSSLLCSIIHE